MCAMPSENMSTVGLTDPLPLVSAYSSSASPQIEISLVGICEQWKEKLGQFQWFISGWPATAM